MSSPVSSPVLLLFSPGHTQQIVGICFGAFALVAIVGAFISLRKRVARLQSEAEHEWEKVARSFAIVHGWEAAPSDMATTGDDQGTRSSDKSVLYEAPALQTVDEEADTTTSAAAVDGGDENRPRRRSSVNRGRWGTLQPQSQVEFDRSQDYVLPQAVRRGCRAPL